MARLKRPKWKDLSEGRSHERIFKMKHEELSVLVIRVDRGFTFNIKLNRGFRHVRFNPRFDPTGVGDSIKEAFADLRISLAEEIKPGVRRAHEKMQRKR